jgi:hypothetical protein
MNDLHDILQFVFSFENEKRERCLYFGDFHIMLKIKGGGIIRGI